MPMKLTTQAKATAKTAFGCPNMLEPAAELTGSPPWRTGAGRRRDGSGRGRRRRSAWRGPRAGGAGAVQLGVGRAEGGGGEPLGAGRAALRDDVLPGRREAEQHDPGVLGI